MDLLFLVPAMPNTDVYDGSTAEIKCYLFLSVLKTCRRYLMISLMRFLHPNGIHRELSIITSVSFMLETWMCTMEAQQKLRVIVSFSTETCRRYLMILLRRFLH
eukprot:c1802_g1_i1 orf=2-310(-)